MDVGRAGGLPEVSDGPTRDTPLSSTDTTPPAWGVIVDALAAALRAHRADMHNTSSRPCSTCSKSAKALALYDAKNASTGRTPHAQ